MCILDHLLSSRLVHPVQFDTKVNSDVHLTIVVLPEGDMTVDAAALHRCLVVFGSQANGALEASCITSCKQLFGVGVLPGSSHTFWKVKRDAQVSIVGSDNPVSSAALHQRLRCKERFGGKLPAGSGQH